MDKDSSSIEKKSLGEVYFSHYVNVIIYRRRICEPVDYQREMGRIFAVLKRQQPCSLKRLSFILGISSSSCSVMIDKLVRTGLVSRTQDMTDRRRVVLTLTDEGEKASDEDYKLQCQRLDDAFSNLSDNDRETLYAAIIKADEIMNNIPLEPETF